MDLAEDLVRRLAAAVRASMLYAPAHPLVQRGVESLATVTARALQDSGQLVIGFVGDEVIVNDARVPRAAASLVGLVRDLRSREVEKITFVRGATRDEVRSFVTEVADRRSAVPLPERLERGGLRHITVGRIVVDDDEDAAA